MRCGDFRSGLYAGRHYCRRFYAGGSVGGLTAADWTAVFAGDGAVYIAGIGRTFCLFLGAGGAV